MSNWKNDKRWSDRFLPEIKGIIGTHLITEPPYEEDAERNTDLMVLRLDAIRIGAEFASSNFQRRILTSSPFARYALAAHKQS